MKEVSHTSPRITLPSPSTATPLNYTSWSHGKWERIHYGVSRWRFHWYNFSLSCWVMFPVWDIWKSGFPSVEKMHAFRSVLLPVFFQIVCRTNARMNTLHYIVELIRVLSLVKTAHPIALTFPLNSKVCWNWYLPPSIWIQRCKKKNLRYLLLLVCIVTNGTLFFRTVLWPTQARSKDEKTIYYISSSNRGEDFNSNNF